MIITRRFFSVRTFLVLVLALILSVATYGFAADNIVPASSAGDGRGDVSGYTVTEVKYVLDTVDPGIINQVTFKLTGTNPPTTTKVQFLNDTTPTATAVGSLYDCTLGAGVYTCSTTGTKATVQPVKSLRVVAAQ